MKVPARALASLFTVLVTTPAWAGRPQTAPGRYLDWGDDDLEELEVVESFRFSEFSCVAVAPLDLSAVLYDGGVSRRELQRTLANIDDVFFKGIREGVRDFSRTPVEAASAPAGRTLVIRAAVVDLDPGSRAARVKIGHGAGAARARVRGEVRDGSTGRLLLRFVHEERAGTGRLGAGSPSQLMLKSAERAGEDVGRVFKAFVRPHP